MGAEPPPLRRVPGAVLRVIDAQRRPTGHVHLAIREAIPRALVKQVTRATHAQQWWSAYGPDHVTYTATGPDHEGLPVWDGENYLDPTTQAPLPTWRQALTASTPPASWGPPPRRT